MAAKKSAVGKAVKESERELSIEEIMDAVEERLRLLEDGRTTLEEAFEAYSEGMDLIKKCDSQIGHIEKRVKEIAEDGSLSDYDE